MPALATIKRIITACAAAAGIAFAGVALAQDAAATAGIGNAVFTVTPANAGAGIPRQIGLSVAWPNSCVPTGATVVGSQISRTRTLTIRLEVRTDAQIACAAVITPYQATVSYTPDAEGDLRVLAITANGLYVGETTIHTRAANSDRAQFDLTGMWYDPATNGSGLTFVHGFTRNDTVFGTWYVYDAAGAPRWYTIQNVQWLAQGLEAEGQIYETRANSIVCTPPFLGCPIALAAVMPLARARIVMQGANAARIDAISAQNGAVLFRSNIIRALF